MEEEGVVVLLVVVIDAVDGGDFVVVGLDAVVVGLDGVIVGGEHCFEGIAAVTVAVAVAGAVLIVEIDDGGDSVGFVGCDAFVGCDGWNGLKFIILNDDDG